MNAFRNCSARNCDGDGGGDCRCESGDYTGVAFAPNNAHTQAVMAKVEAMFDRYIATTNDLNTITWTGYNSVLLFLSLSICS